MPRKLPRPTALLSTVTQHLTLALPLPTRLLLMRLLRLSTTPLPVLHASWHRPRRPPLGTHCCAAPSRPSSFLVRALHTGCRWHTACMHATGCRRQLPVVAGACMCGTMLAAGGQGAAAADACNTPLDADACTNQRPASPLPTPLPPAVAAVLNPNVATSSKCAAVQAPLLTRAQIQVKVRQRRAARLLRLIRTCSSVWEAEGTAAHLLALSKGEVILSESAAAGATSTASSPLPLTTGVYSIQTAAGAPRACRHRGQRGRHLRPLLLPEDENDHDYQQCDGDCAAAVRQQVRLTASRLPQCAFVTAAAQRGRSSDLWLPPPAATTTGLLPPAGCDLSLSSC